MSRQRHPRQKKETDAWSYVQHLKESGAAPTTATSFVQSLQFCHHTLGLSGALTAADSRRIGGSAELQLALKPPARQARPLTVAEVRRLHSIACSADRNVLDRVMASNLLCAIYGRCRSSDMNVIHEILHDASGKAGFWR